MFVLPVAPAFHRRASRGAPFAFAHLLADRALAEETPEGHELRVPRIDVLENDRAYIVVLDMPGVGKDRLNVSIEGRRLVVSTTAETAQSAAPAEGEPPATVERVLYRERSAPTYARTVVLPADVDQASSQARFENGVLTLTLAKRVPAGATQIRVD